MGRRYSLDKAPIRRGENKGPYPISLRWFLFEICVGFKKQLKTHFENQVLYVERSYLKAINNLTLSHLFNTDKLVVRFDILNRITCQSHGTLQRPSWSYL